MRKQIPNQAETQSVSTIMRVSADDMQLEMYSTYRHKKTHLKNQMCFLVFRQRLTFPGGRPPSIISAKELNYCVRDGNRCDLFAIATEYMSNTLRCIDLFVFVVSKTERRSFSISFFCSLSMAYSIIS